MSSQSIAIYLSRHELRLNQLVRESIIPSEQIKNAILYSLFPGGKRLRPTLVYLSGEILGIDIAVLDLIAAAIELTHCYSLIHDDLPAMDNDDFRRGKPSCHKAFDEATAILAGDGMQALAIEILLTHLNANLTPEQLIKVITELVHASGTAGMVSGQSLDLSELSKASIDESQLRTIHSLKTGKLITACVSMTIAAAQTSDLTIEKALHNYAEYLGLVFQMQDDYLDHYAQTDLLGKGRASDQANQKITFSSLYTKEELGTLINQYFAKAKKALNPLGEKARDLQALTDSLRQRSA
ncbi:MAG: polyprenyl synthetase family protein [Tatlockia sp.]|nr:polyprenyl synthetase family protein [Tatlockia sp.]